MEPLQAQGLEEIARQVDLRPRKAKKLWAAPFKNRESHPTSCNGTGKTGK
jgi:hypothetical protein